MTELLEQAIHDLRKLSETSQDEAAEFLFNLMAKRSEPIKLEAETRVAVRRGRDQARRGEFATDEEMTEFFAQHKE